MEKKNKLWRVKNNSHATRLRLVLFRSLHAVTSSVILLQYTLTENGNLFVNYIQDKNFTDDNKMSYSLKNFY